MLLSLQNEILAKFGFFIHTNSIIIQLRKHKLNGKYLASEERRKGEKPLWIQIYPLPFTLTQPCHWRGGSFAIKSITLFYKQPVSQPKQSMSPHIATFGDIESPLWTSLRQGRAHPRDQRPPSCGSRSAIRCVGLPRKGPISSWRLLWRVTRRTWENGSQWELWQLNTALSMQCNAK